MIEFISRKNLFNVIAAPLNAEDAARAEMVLNFTFTDPKKIMN
ncbi:MAG: alkyl sulfatase BDS1-like metallo-beta-lactamase superfamily hydrolase [Zhongshania sp.]|jgi:alkyl sulfatase BDS1-like metallo-beta-lactamase superfamily hydrolase